MKHYICKGCGWEYDPEMGAPDNDIAPGIAFESLTDDCMCPICGTEKEDFMEI